MAEKMADRTQKLSIRFYKDREVRAVWREETNRWYFSVLDVVGGYQRAGRLCSHA